MEDQFTKTLIEYGVLGLLVWFFVFQGQKREEKMLDRINEIENYVQQTLSTTLVEVTQTLTQVSSIVKRNTEVMERLENYLEKIESSHGESKKD